MLHMSNSLLMRAPFTFGIIFKLFFQTHCHRCIKSSTSCAICLYKHLWTNLSFSIDRLNVSVVKQVHAGLTSANTITNIRWIGVQHLATGLHCSSGNMFCGTNHASFLQSYRHPDFGECRKNNTQPDCFVPIVKCSGGGIRLCGCFSWIGLDPLAQVTGNQSASVYQHIVDNSPFPALWNFLEKSLFCSSMSVPQCTKPGPLI